MLGKLAVIVNVDFFEVPNLKHHQGGLLSCGMPGTYLCGFMTLTVFQYCKGFD